MRRRRVKSRPFPPKFEPEIRGWAANFIRANRWRVPGYIDESDLMQDAYLCFQNCKNRYRYRVKNAGHFMALFKRTFTNHIHDLSLGGKRHRSVDASSATIIDQDGAEQNLLDRMIGPFDNEGFLRVLLREAPSEIKDLAKAIIAETIHPALIVHHHRYRIKRRVVRETTNEKICRTLKLDPDEINVVDKIKEWLRV